MLCASATITLITLGRRLGGAESPNSCSFCSRSSTPLMRFRGSVRHPGRCQSGIRELEQELKKPAGKVIALLLSLR